MVRSPQQATPAARTNAARAWHLALVLIFLIGCGERGVEKARKNPISQLPAGATTVGVLNFDLLRQRPDFPKMEQELLSDPESRARLEKFKAKTGTDLLHDTGQIAFGVYADKAEFSFLGIMVGKFDENRIVAAIREEAPAAPVESKKHAKMNYYTIVESKTGRPRTFAFAFPSPQIALFATDENLLFRGLDTLGGKGAPMEKDANFKSLLQRSDAQSTLWVVGLIPESLRDKLRDSMARDLAHVQKYSVRLRWLADLSLEIRLTSETEDEANAVLSTLLGFKGMGSMLMHPQTSRGAKFLEKLSLRSEKSDVFISLDLTQQEVDALLAETRPTSRTGSTSDTLPLSHP
ncbi:MAG: hypothetical protein V2A74_07905 [bacterium]